MTIFSVKTDNLAAMIQQISSLQKKSVYVGVPEAETVREGEPVNNATLAYIHDNGAPASNIPARPFLREGVEQSLPKAEKQLKKAVDLALSGKSAEPALHGVGLVAQNSVRNYISTADFVPLAKSTLEARAARKGKGVRIGKGAQAELDARARGEAPSNENARPLIDTGELRKSITYAIRGD